MENIFETLGYDIITDIQFNKMDLNENNEINEYFNKEQFEINNIRDFIDYDLHDIKEIKTDNDNKIVDMEYNISDKNISYLEPYMKQDYIGLMNWYINKYPYIPGIENLSYIFSKRDLTGKVKLDKYEKVIIKKELKKQQRAEEIVEQERNKYIRKLEREKYKPITTMKIKRKNITLKF